MFPGELSCGLVGLALLLSHAARLAWPAGVPLLLACAPLLSAFAPLPGQIPARAAPLLSHAAFPASLAYAPLLLACAALAARIPALAALLSADAALLAGPSPKPPLSLPLPRAISATGYKVYPQAKPLKQKALKSWRLELGMKAIAGRRDCRATRAVALDEARDSSGKLLLGTGRERRGIGALSSRAMVSTRVSCESG